MFCTRFHSPFAIGWPVLGETISFKLNRTCFSSHKTFWLMFKLIPVDEKILELKNADLSRWNGDSCTLEQRPVAFRVLEIAGEVLGFGKSY